MKNSARRYPFPIRVWHWLHAFFVLALVVTGMPLWNPGIKILSYDTSAISHTYLGFLLAGSFVFWLVHCPASGRFARDYVPTAEDLRNLPKQLILHLFFYGKRHPVLPESHSSAFSPIQKVAYLCIMVILMPVSILTGIVLSNTGQVFLPIQIVGDVERLYAVHLASGYILFLFLIVHICVATLHRPWWSRYRSMITGFDGENEPISSKE